MDDDPELEFEFFLADRLRMPVAEMRQRVSHHELVFWSRYHARRAAERELAAKMAGG